MPDPRYAVLLVPTARRAFQALPSVERRRIGRVIDRLAVNPRPPGAALLAGRPDERIWRIRAGDFRVLYEVGDRELTVLVIRIGHRREVYERR